MLASFKLVDSFCSPSALLTMISLVLMRKVEIRINEPPFTRFVVSVSTEEETPEWLEASAFNTSKEVKEFLMVLGVFDPEKPGDPMWPGDPIKR